MSIAIPTRETADAEYGTATRERSKLQERRSKLLERSAELHGLARHEDERAKIKAELDEVDEKLRGLGSQLPVLKLRASGAGAEALVTSAAYQRLLRASLEAWSRRLEPWLEFWAVTREALRNGLAVQPLPPSVAVEISECQGWLGAAIRRGTIDGASVPPPLRSLLEKEGAR